MRALILAAGRGSRMRHLTETHPKAMTPLGGRPLIERQCSALRAAGVTEIGIVTGYMADRFDAHADAAFHNPRWADTQMVSSLEAAESWLDAGPVIVSYSDIFYEPHVPQALAQTGADIAITYDPNWEDQWRGRFGDPLIDSETFRFRTEDGRRYLTEIGRPPRSLDEVQGQYMGLLRFTPAGWAAVREARATLAAAPRDAQSMTELLDLLISRDAQIEAVAVTGRWGEIDSVEDLAFFEAHPELFP